MTIDVPVRDQPADEAVASRAVAGTSRHRPVGESVARGALALLSTQPLTWAATLLAGIVMPRLLGAEGLGQYTIVMSIGALATTAASLGIPDFLIRRIAQQPHTLSRDLSIALLVQTVCACLFALAFAVLAPLFASSLPDARLLDVALVGMIFGPAQALLLSAFRGREQHVHYAWVNACGVVVSTVGGVVALLLGADLLTFLAITLVLTNLATFVGWGISGLRPASFRLDRSLLIDARELILRGLPFVTWSLTLAIYGGIDRLLLGAFVSPAEVGWYAAAYRIIGISVFIPTLFVAPLFPALSRSVHEPDAIRAAIAHTLRASLLLTVPINALMIVVAQVVPSLLGWPAEFTNAVPLMIILSLHVPVVAVDMVLATVVMAIGREAAWIRVGLVACVFNIVLNLVTIPLFEHVAANGAIGASIVTVGTELVMSIGAITLIPKNLLDPKLTGQAARILLAGLITVLVGIVLLQVTLMLAIVGGAAAYIGVAALLRSASLSDFRLLTQRFSHPR